MSHPEATRLPDSAPDRLLFAPRPLPPLPPDAWSDTDRYAEWRRARDDGRPPRFHQEGEATIAVVMIVDRPDTAALTRSLRSVIEQTSSSVELSLAVIGEVSPEATVALEQASRGAPGVTVKITRHPSGTEHPAAANVALSQGTAPFVVLLGQHDELDPDALSLLGQTLAETTRRAERHRVVVYADEDQLVEVRGLDGRGDRERPPGGSASWHPVLKPDWSPELLWSTPYIGRPFLVPRELVLAIGGVADVPDGDWEHDLMLRITEASGSVLHVAHVLYHRWSEPSVPTGGSAVRSALERADVEGLVEPGPIDNSWTVIRRVTGRPTVTIVVPFRDQPRFLRTCVDSITATAGDLALDIVLVDNGSAEPETVSLIERFDARPDVTVLRDDRPFNWPALNNAAVSAAKGDVLVFCNNDVEATTTGWLEQMVAQAQRPDVGVVGARLLYPGGRVQHAGMVIGLGGAAGHVLAGLEGDRPGYLGLAVLARDCTAVTGACLATRRAVFDELGGFDEGLGLDLNDVDYCLQARRHGYRVLFEPSAELVHHESPSRGTSGSATDIRRFVDRWETEILAGDPFLNPNLTRVDSSCALCGPDEEGWWQTWRSNLPRS